MVFDQDELAEFSSVLKKHPALREKYSTEPLETWSSASINELRAVIEDEVMGELVDELKGEEIGWTGNEKPTARGKVLERISDKLARFLP